MSASNYPALLDLTTQKLHPLRSAESFLVGRNESADICVLDPTCSRHHFRIARRERQYFLESLSTSNVTLCNGKPVARRQALAHGALIQAGQTRFQFLMRAPTRNAPPPAAAEEVPETIRPAQIGSAGSVPECGVIPLSGTMVIGREEGRVHVHLPHPLVSRMHASLALQGKCGVLVDLNSSNGTYVNGNRIRTATQLRPGDQIDIGPYALQFTGTALLPRSRTDNIELVAREVSRVVHDRDTGKPLRLLDGINLVIRPREFVCLLGPSGSGKSTLLSLLSGRTCADHGAVLLNGKDLYANFAAIKQDIAVVPQKDVLHDSLSVGSALWYTARMRLPPDTSEPEIETSLVEMLDTVGLAARRGTRIRDLSGGQVKRASLANEILCKPSLLFLDEVTSGLDEQTDREMMNLFRSLADEGKTVVCITHSLANVERTCHLVVILTAGGKLAFMGKPEEALAYFKIERLGDVYDRLAEQSAEHWQAEFLQSPLYQRYVADRLPPPSVEAREPVQRPASSSTRRLRLYYRQTSLLTRRYFAIWRGDYPSLLAMAGQALLVGVLLGILFGDISKLSNPIEHAQRSLNLLFLLAVSSFWFGCNNAAKEIVKERTIYSRERDFNLLVSSYYSSKLLLLALFSGLQAVLLFVLVSVCCGPPGPFATELLVLLALALAGTTIGLAISAGSRSEEMAVTLIPMAIIPQIILSGVIAPLDGLSKVLALTGITTYWGKRGLDACLPEHVARAVALEQHSTGGAIGVLLVHALLGVIAALLLLHMNTLRRKLLPLLR